MVHLKFFRALLVLPMLFKCEFYQTGPERLLMPEEVRSRASEREVERERVYASNLSMNILAIIACGYVEPARHSNFSQSPSWLLQTFQQSRRFAEMVWKRDANIFCHYTSSAFKSVWPLAGPVLPLIWELAMIFADASPLCRAVSRKRNVLRSAQFPELAWAKLLGSTGKGVLEALPKLSQAWAVFLPSLFAFLEPLKTNVCIAASDVASTDIEPLVTATQDLAQSVMYIVLQAHSRKKQDYLIHGHASGRAYHEVLLSLVLSINASFAAEIGVYEGTTSRYILEHTSPEFRLLGVDNGLDPNAFQFRELSNREETHSRYSTAVMAAQHVYAEHWARSSLVLMDSQQAAALVLEDSLDLVFIDAGHSYEECRQDIVLWAPKVRSGGIVGGHDYDLAFEGVVRAVQEAVPAGTTLHLSRSVWWFYKE